MRLWRPLAFALCLFAAGASAETPRPETLLQTLELMQEALVESLPGVTSEVDAQDLQLRIADDPSGASVILNPENLHRQLQSAPSEAARTLILADFLATIEQMLTDEPEKRSLDQLRPVVRAPLDFGQTPVEARPIVEPFIGGLVIYYVWDSAESVSYVTRADLEAFGLTEASMIARARANFLEAPPELGYEDLGVVLLVADGFYESSFLLDIPLWMGIEEAFGPVLVVAPARDAVLFAPASDLTLRGDLLAFREDILEEAAYPLSDQLFLWRDGEWRVVSDVP